MIKINKTATTSSYLLEEYFPIKINFGNYNEESHKTYLRIDYDDSNALEILFNKNKQKEISELNLLLASNFDVFNYDLIIPQITDNYSISLSKSEKNIANIFNVEIYNNCIKLAFENKTITSSVLCGNVIFSFDEEMKIISIILTNINSDVHDHIIKELENNL